MLTKFIDNACEDSLTAAVFTHLLHLPSEVFWQILRNACHTTSLPEYAGEPRSVEFWPKWNPNKTRNASYVEPDVFIRFNIFDLIIEAKREDEGQQYRQQWENEVTAYDNEYGHENVPVRMIALGGIWDTKDDEVPVRMSVCPVHMCRWSTLLLECQRLKRELEEENKHAPTSRISADIRILNNLCAFFAAHGYAALRWFEDFDFKSNLPSPSVDSDQQYFRNISLQFQAS